MDEKTHKPGDILIVDRETGQKEYVSVEALADQQIERLDLTETDISQIWEVLFRKFDVESYLAFWLVEEGPQMMVKVTPEQFNEMLVPLLILHPDLLSHLTDAVSQAWATLKERSEEVQDH